MRSVYLITVCLLGCMSAINTISLAQSYGSLTGIIADDSTGKSLEGAHVFIKELKKGATTSESGEFTLEKLPEGVYSLEVSMLGYHSKKVENVDVHPGEVTELQIRIVSETIIFDELVISATKYAQSIKNISSPVYVIGKRELLQSEGRNIDEVFQTIPGVYSEDRFHSNYNLISFRGIGLHSHVTRGILVLVDGVPVNEAMGRTVFEGVDMENIRKLEVIKGPVSALYGPNAITGVINILEREPEEGTHGEVTTGAGSYDAYRLGGNIRGGNKSFSYLVKANYQYSGGYQEHSNYGMKLAGINLRKEFGQFGRVGLTTDYILSTANYGGTLDSVAYHERSREATKKFAGSDKKLFRMNINHIKKWKSAQLFSYIGAQRRYDEGHYSDANFGTDDIWMYRAEVRLSSSSNLLGKESSLSVGGNIEFENGKESLNERDEETGEIGVLTDDGRSKYRIAGLYLQEEFSLVKQLTLTFGVRVDEVNYRYNDLLEQDENENYKNNIMAVSPKFGFAYNPNKNITIFGNAGKGFNPPQISQLFIGSSYSGLPNPDLKPEYLVNAELGVRGNVNDRIQYQCTIFDMRFEDQIVADGEPAVYENIGETHHKGIETALQVNPGKNLTAYLNYSYLNARFEDHPEYQGNKLCKSPENQLGMGLRYNLSTGTILSVDYKWTGPYFMDNEEVNSYDGHSLLNAKIIQSWKSFDFSLRVDNIFNVNYATYANASKSFNRQSRTYEWNKSYYRGWPTNYSFRVQYNFK